MISVLVSIKIKPGYRDAFVEALLDDARGSVGNEHGCFRFDVLQDDDNRNLVYGYEVYENQAAFKKHQTMPHFAKCVETFKDWFDGEPETKSVTTVFPTDRGWRKQKPHLLGE